MEEKKKSKKWLVQILNPGGSPAKWKITGKLYASTVNYKIIGDNGKEYYFPIGLTLICERNE